ncbi:23S rRNA (adenine(2503)-C(2))-methyltransferase RlmN, partial [Hungatella sp. SL.1.14]|nr:23S rRNA (adenine(2503)-C(2))-methyltransferase RlmN [Hungatella sp. SL.1.14]
MEKTDIKSLNLEELTAFITVSGEKAFRAKQLYEWMHKKLAPGYEEMTNLPKALKERLKETCEYTALQTVDEKISAIDRPNKYFLVPSMA